MTNEPWMFARRTAATRLASGNALQLATDGIEVGSRRWRRELRRIAYARAQAAFSAWVGRSDDRRLERVAGSSPGLRLLFAVMQASFVAAEADGARCEVGFELHRLDGTTRSWTLRINPDQARLRRGQALAPQLSVKVGLADFVRIAGRELDVGDALLTGRINLEGDFVLATRLGGMFGRAGL